MKIKFVFIKKSRSQVLEEYWKGTESTFYEVQHETLTISDVLGCHIICWCFLKSTVNTALYLSWFFCSLPCFVLLHYLSHSCWLVHCSFPCRCLFKHLFLSRTSVMQVKALKHSCPMFFYSESLFSGSLSPSCVCSSSVLWVTLILALKLVSCTWKLIIASQIFLQWISKEECPGNHLYKVKVFFLKTFTL